MRHSRVILSFFLFLLPLSLCLEAWNSTLGVYLNAVTTLSESVPKCGLGCILNQPAPGINTSCTDTASGAACFCSDDINYYLDVLQCLRSQCSIEEATATARTTWDACDRPRRSRKQDMLGGLALEIPAFICALLRFVSRWQTGQSRFYVDDYFMMAVTVLFVGFEAAGSAAAQLAFGTDIWLVKSAHIDLSAKLFYAGETLYLIILALAKLSVLCFYLRVFSDRIFRIWTYTVMAWVGISGVVFVFLQLFQCLPVKYFWEMWTRGSPRSYQYRCLGINTLALAIAGCNLAQDLAIFILPLPLAARLDESRRTKVGIMVMFSLGIFVCITSCVRIWTMLSFGESANPTWDYTDALIWTGLEVAVSIIVTSLPAIRALFSHLFTDASETTLPQHHSASSFGNLDESYVRSFYDQPPALKRISAISQISTIVVRLGEEKYGNPMVVGHIELAESVPVPEELVDLPDPVENTTRPPDTAGEGATPPGMERESSESSWHGMLSIDQVLAENSHVRNSLLWADRRISGTTIGEVDAKSGERGEEEGGGVHAP